MHRPPSTRRRSLLTGPLTVIAVALTACGGDDDDTTSTTAGSPSGTVPAAEEPADDAPTVAAPAEPPALTAPTAPTAPDQTAEPAEPAAPDGTGSGTATLTLANGDRYEFSVLCTLEPQMAAGSEILFTATSYDEIGFDITQFGNEGTVTDLATVEVWDAEFETLWEANSMYAPMGGSLELALDGTTIRGVGDFFPEGDIVQQPVAGEVVANC